MSGNFVLKILDRYRLKNRTVPILVEGKNDVGSLRRLSFDGEIITLNSGHSLVTLSGKISEDYREIIILTDFDRTGRELKSQLNLYLSGSGCRVDTYLWERLGRYLPVKTVEELPTSVLRIEKELGLQ